MDDGWEPRRVVVLGAGAMGCLFGGVLHTGGLDVSLLDRWPEHVAAIRRDGLRLIGHGGERTIAVPATTEPETLTPPDLLLVQCKALHTAEALAGAAGLLAPSTVVISFQNGLGNEEVIAGIVGRERMLGGLTAQGATVMAPGVVRNFGELPTWVGELGGGASARARRVAETFTAAGLDTRASDDIMRDKWKKLLANIGFSALSAITDLSSREIMGVAELRATVMAAVEEARLVAAACGHVLDPAESREMLMRVAVAEAGGTGDAKSSACTDLRNGRRTEVDFISGAVVRLGARHRIPTPVNQTLVAAVKGLETRCV
ncbi:MAG: 2-dehydropantoate 2-reductase [Ectothiorhodospiraceae bacterium]|nr:2-dehydropantoate 2-reductase [Ectothiorhodospiraceae bacterium]